MRRDPTRAARQGSCPRQGRPPLPVRAGALGLSALVLSSLLASCLGPQALPAEDAPDHYEQVRQDVIGAVGAEGLDLTVREEPLVETVGGTCVFDPGTWEADEELFGDDESSWEPLLDPLNEVLEEHDFETVAEFDHTNGEAFRISVVDDHGLRLRVYTLEGSTVMSMHGAAVDTDGDCTHDALGV